MCHCLIDLNTMPPVRIGRLLLTVLLAVLAFVVYKRQSTTEEDATILEEDTLLAEWRDESHVKGQYTKRMVAVGDIHSDYGNALKVLQMANVVDVHGNWSGNIDSFIQTGDIIDRCVLSLCVLLKVELK